MKWLDDLSAEAKRQINPYGLALFTLLVVAIFIAWLVR